MSDLIGVFLIFVLVSGTKVLIIYIVQIDRHTGNCEHSYM